MAETTKAQDKPEAEKPLIVATWVGLPGMPAIPGTERVLTKKQVRESLVMETTRDLVWSHATNHRADVSAESTEFLDWLDAQPEFKVTGRS